MALKDFEKANQLKPSNKMVLLNLGKANIALGKAGGSMPVLASV